MYRIAGYPEYSVTDDGRIWSEKSKKFLKPFECLGNYLAVNLCKNRKFNRHFIHRLVLETFTGPCPEKMECRHLDGNPQNNHFRNLCWGTRKENTVDRELHNRTARGARIGNSKLSTQDILEIKRLYKTGHWLYRELAEVYGVAKSTIGQVVRQETWMSKLLK